MWNRAFGEVIKLARKKSGMTQAQAASALCVTQSKISRWELGRELPDVRQTFLLLRMFEWDFDRLIVMVNQMEAILAERDQVMAKTLLQTPEELKP